MYEREPVRLTSALQRPEPATLQSYAPHVGNIFVTAAEPHAYPDGTIRVSQGFRFDGLKAGVYDDIPQTGEHLRWQDLQRAIAAVGIAGLRNVEDMSQNSQISAIDKLQARLAQNLGRVADFARFGLISNPLRHVESCLYVAANKRFITRQPEKTYNLSVHDMEVYLTD